MKPLFLFTLVSLSTLGASLNAQQSFIAGWDFDSAPGVVLQPFFSDSENVPQTMTANFGSGTLHLDGTNGSSVWLREGELTSPTNSDSRQLAVTAGVNHGGGTTDRALGLVQPRNGLADGNNANGKSIVFAFSMEGFVNLDITYDYRRSNGQQFRELVWETSTNASDWTLHETLTYPSSGEDWTTEERLSSITSLVDSPNAYIRVTFNDADGNPGGDRAFQVNNIELNATPIP